MMRYGICLLIGIIARFERFARLCSAFAVEMSDDVVMLLGSVILLNYGLLRMKTGLLLDLMKLDRTTPSSWSQLGNSL